MSNLDVTYEADAKGRASIASWLVRDKSLGDVAVRLFHSAFIRNVLLLSSGTAARQIILLATAPVLTRLYCPDDFGTLAIFATIVSLIAVISALRYEMAIPLPASELAAAEVLVLGVVSVVVTASAAAIALWAMNDWIESWLGGTFPRLGLWLVPIAVLGTGFQSVLGFWAIRRRKYSHLAGASVAQTVGQIGCQVGTGLLGAGAIGLIVGEVAGTVCSGATLLQQCWRTTKVHLRQVTSRGVLRAAARYRRFPAISSWAALLNTAGIYLPLMLFAAFYDLRVVGWLVLAQRILGAPITLLSNAVGKVYLSECAHLRNEAPQRLPRLFWKTVFSQTAVAGLLICAALPAPLVFSFIFGDEWRMAGWCLLVLSPAFAAKLVAGPLGATLDVLEMQWWHIGRELTRLALTAAAITVAAVTNAGPLAALIVLSTASTIAYCVGTAIVWRIIRGVSLGREPHVSLAA
jgi:O-antigen/teichoic acid export membrane protein